MRSRCFRMRAPSALLRPAAAKAAEPAPSISALEAFSIEAGAPPADASVPVSDSVSGPAPQKTTDVPQKVPCPIDPRIEVDKNCNLIPASFERQQPHRILGFMPNFRSVSAGAVAHPPGWKYNFKMPPPAV